MGREAIYGTKEKVANSKISEYAWTGPEKESSFLAIAYFEQKEDLLKQKCELDETIIFESNTPKTI